MNKPILLVALAVLAGTAAIPAMAQSADNADDQMQMAGQGLDDGPDDGDMRHRRKGRHGGHHGERQGGRDGGPRMMMIDANADGTIGEDEAAALADQMFMHHDQNQNCSLTEAEFTTPPHRGGWFNWGNSDEAAAVLKVRKDKFAAFDTDKNGSVTKAEFFVEAKARLAAADTDKDGKVTPWEFRALPRP